MRPVTSNQENSAFTGPQQRALSILRLRYQQDHDLFADPELARLRFLRWLHQSGRLAPDGQLPARTPC